MHRDSVTADGKTERLANLCQQQRIPWPLSLSARRCERVRRTGQLADYDAATVISNCEGSIRRVDLIRFNVGALIHTVASEIIYEAAHENETRCA